MLLFRQGADSPARLYSAMALALNPDFIEARLLMGHIMAYKGQLDAAYAQYIAVPEKSDSYLKSRREAADILEEAGRIDEAIELLEGLHAKFDDVEAEIQIGDIYRRAKDFDKALLSYQSALQTVDKDYQNLWHLYYLRGMSYEQLDQFEKAKSDLNKALELRPENPYILNYLGYSLADRGENLPRALELIRKAVKLEPDDGYITDSLGWVLYRLGRYEEAVPHLERAVELLPYDPVINDHLGDAYWQVGRKIEARFQWRRAFNHAEDEKLLALISQKIDEGLQGNTYMLQASQSRSEEQLPKSSDTGN